jgi:hypothetical protein
MKRGFGQRLAVELGVDRRAQPAVLLPAKDRGNVVLTAWASRDLIVAGRQQLTPMPFTEGCGGAATGGLLSPLRGFLVGEVACHLGLTPQALRDRPFGAG